jgi:hypothetical protein
LWKHLELDRFFEQVVDDDPADVAWLRCWRSIGCAPGSELAVEERWYPATELDDLLGDRRGQDQRHTPVPPHKTKLEQHLKQRYGDLFRAEFDVLLYNSTSTYVEGAAEKNPMMVRGDSRDHRPDCDRGIVSEENLARIRKRGGQYLLGAPRRQMKRFEAELLKEDWIWMRRDVEVQRVAIPQGNKTYILCRTDRP